MDIRQLNQNNIPQKENPHTLYNFFNKLNASEPQTFGNYCVNYIELFPTEEESKDYLKNHVSLFNDDPVSKEKIMNGSNVFNLPKSFENYEEKTLLYIFYFMTREHLQLFAAYSLYKKKWIYDYKHQIWFKKNKDNGKLYFFNPIEWKLNEYIFGAIEPHNFLNEDEVKSYLQQEKKKESKKKQGHKTANNNPNNNNNPQTNNSGNSSQKTEQKKE